MVNASTVLANASCSAAADGRPRPVGTPRQPGRFRLLTELQHGAPVDSAAAASASPRRWPSPAARPSAWRPATRRRPPRPGRREPAATPDSARSSSSQWPPITNSWLLKSCTSRRTLRACSWTVIVIAPVWAHRHRRRGLETRPRQPRFRAHGTGPVAEAHPGARGQEPLDVVPALARPDPLAVAQIGSSRSRRLTRPGRASSSATRAESDRCSCTTRRPTSTRATSSAGSNGLVR